MHVRFEMSGGYGGLFAHEPLAVDVESEDLPVEERPRFEELARAARDASPAPSEPSDAATDLMSYRLHIIDNDNSYDLVLDDLTVPDPTWPLIEFMRDLAIRRRTKE